ncbi:MAG TPA: archease [Fimbriimonadales bacterium]|nr:archease [Fimbriimonadales bacterium]
MSEPRWEHFSHEADIGVRGIAPSLNQAFEQAALALTAVITDPNDVAQETCVEIQCSAPDKELLLFEWLNALVYEMSIRNMIFGKYEVEIHDSALSAKAWGENIKVEKHHPAVEIKGATYTALRVKQDENGLWIAECVVDV